MRAHFSRSDIVSAITDAFKGVSRGDGITLHEAEAIDCYADAAERAASRGVDIDAHWSEVPAVDIERICSALSFLDPIGHRYYLPAYMIWTVEHYDSTASATPDLTLAHVTMLTDPISGNRDRLAALNHAQRRATAMFLQYFASVSSDSRIAASLREYWGKYLTDQDGEAE